MRLDLGDGVSCREGESGEGGRGERGGVLGENDGDRVGGGW